jgi:predicted ATPase
MMPNENAFMLDSVKIHDFRGLKDCQLLSLGRVNIVCGRNNSGKTTMLSALAAKDDQGRESEQRWTAGTRLDEATVSKVIEGLSNTFRGDHLRLAKGAVRSIIEQRDMWLVGHEESFADEVILSLQRANLPIASSTTRDIKRLAIEAYRAGMPASPPTDSIVFIPAKRRLQVSPRLNPLRGVKPGGEEVLESLFHFKNTPPGHPKREVYSRIEKAFSSITSGHTFDISIEDENRLHLYFSFDSSAWTSADASGLGFQDLLIMLFFASQDEYKILLIEEPESHLHPEMQRKLLNFFRQETEKQYFLSTHSNVFLDNAYVDKVLFTRYDGGVIHVEDATSRASVLDDIGYSVADNLVADLIILTEGISDQAVIEEFLKQMGLFANYSIRLWALGGDIMSQQDLSVFQQNYKIVALIDSDPGSKKERRRFLANCKELGVHVHQLKRYAIENYFSLEAIKQVFPNQVDAAVTVIDENTKLEDQLGFSVKKGARKVARAMSLTDVSATDLQEFLEYVRFVVSE